VCAGQRWWHQHRKATIAALVNNPDWIFSWATEITAIKQLCVPTGTCWGLSEYFEHLNRWLYHRMRRSTGIANSTSITKSKISSSDLQKRASTAVVADVRQLFVSRNFSRRRRLSLWIDAKDASVLAGLFLAAWLIFVVTGNPVTISNMATHRSFQFTGRFYHRKHMGCVQHRTELSQARLYKKGTSELEVTTKLQ